MLFGPPSFDKAVIGTNYGEWKKQKPTEDKDLLRFITVEEEILQVRLGDFAIFTDFLKMLIGNISETNKDSKND